MSRESEQSFGAVISLYVHVCTHVYTFICVYNALMSSPRPVRTIPGT